MLNLASFPPLALPHNSSILSEITPTTLGAPWYFTTRPALLPWVSDRYLTIAAPVLMYWVLSFVFYLIDIYKIPYFEARKIHESPQVLARNRATVSQVVKAVIVQHVIQISLAIIWLDSEEEVLRRGAHRDHLAAMRNLAPHVARGVFLLLGKSTGEAVLRSGGERIVQWVYWWGIPFAQMMFAFFFLDTWQYTLHRLFHTSRFLYRHFHSVHHRLYVPYAFGALYNHPVEGFVLDSLGAAVAEVVAGLTIRQACLLFAFSTMKTVDDHCGYRLWWDPCQMFFYNNVDYHDIHHQAYGIKANFSQPFFTNWDYLLGTQMTREQADNRTRKTSKLAKSE